MNEQKHVVVIGGGAAGFFCAINVARMDPACRVTIIEKSGKLLSKVRISGGGRCNVTHACDDIAAMSEQYPRGKNFVKKIFHRFFVPDTIAWFAARGVKLKTEPDGRMFPVSDSSETIIRCFLEEAKSLGIEIHMNQPVEHIHRDGEKFIVQLPGSSPSADRVCIAAGGYPQSRMFDWIRETGHSIEEPVPSLFTFNLPGHPIRELMGVSVPMGRVKIKGMRYESEGPVLITHWGLSGPAVLRMSALAARELEKEGYQFGVTINWVANLSEPDLREQIRLLRMEHPAQKILSRKAFDLPARLWEFLARQSGVTPEMRWADLPATVQNRLVQQLLRWEAEVKGKTTFKEEFVTAGGVQWQEIDPQTMMSRKIPGLYFAGEVVNVDGVTGGFNFQFAWTSGYIAAASMAV